MFVYKSLTRHDSLSRSVADDRTHTTRRARRDVVRHHEKPHHRPGRDPTSVRPPLPPIAASHVKQKLADFFQAAARPRALSEPEVAY